MEAFQTERNEADNIDSPALWHGPNGENWLISTAKKGNRLVVNDAATGALIKDFGTTGNKAGEFLRPNGIMVIDSILIVVERDNKRAQVFSLPGFKTLGFIGDSLIKPYGIAGYKTDKDSYRIYITDCYETADEQVPPPADLGKRVHCYDIKTDEGKFESKLEKTFGDTSGEGVLYIVESIYADTAHNKLLIAEEDTSRSGVKVYDLNGKFTGTVFGKGVFKHQVEGIALYECGKEGYWIISDQDHNDNRFRAFTRTDFKYVGSFWGPKTSNTDGIALTQKAYGGFKKGAFFAADDDGAMSAFDFSAIADSLKLETPCN